MTKPILCYGKIGLSHCELKRHSLNLKNAAAFVLQNPIKHAKKKMHGRCTFDALLVFPQNLLTSRKLEKKLRKFFPFSKFTKLVNLLVLETQGWE